MTKTLAITAALLLSAGAQATDSYRQFTAGNPDIGSGRISYEGVTAVQPGVGSDIYRYHGGSVLGVEEVPPEETHKYGIVSSSPVDDRVGRVHDIIEKPAPAEAPTNLGVVGRYILSARIFDRLERTEAGAGGEIQLTDAIADLMREEQVLSSRFAGTRYDCGSKLGYLEATVRHALKHPELGEDFRAYLRDLAL